MKLSSKQKILGFGFNPEESEHHYTVYIKAAGKEVVMFELMEYNGKHIYETLAYKIASAVSPARCILPMVKWELIRDDLRAEFNKRLKEIGLPPAQWKQCFNLLHRMLGKEMLVLAWAVEEADPGTINLAIQNWLGLRPEERWWLFTMTNAATGHALNGKSKGWRKALRFALTENPVTADRLRLNIHAEAELPGLFEEDAESKKFGSK
jgi:hypothetical protein